MIRGRFLTAANLLSLSRVPLAGAASWFILQGDRGLVALFLFLAALTDWLDGRVARSTRTVSDWGRILDPAADKVSFILVAAALIKAGLLVPWMLWLLLARDGLIVLGGLIISRSSAPPSSNHWGKWASTAMAVFLIRQALFPCSVLPGGEILPGADALGILAVLLVVISFLSYALIFFRADWRSGAT